jgi:hypothetical protein
MFLVSVVLTNQTIVLIALTDTVTLHQMVVSLTFVSQLQLNAKLEHGNILTLMVVLIVLISALLDTGEIQNQAIVNLVLLDV